MMEDYSLQYSQDYTAKGRKWVIKNPKANIVIFEGMEEHLVRYNKFAEYLNKEGYSVYGLDCFGQGANVNEDLSNIGVWPDNGFIIQIDIYAKMVDSISIESKKPTYIFAHSMGSFMAQGFIERYPDVVNKVVLCGSGAKNPALPIALALASAINKGDKKQQKAKLLNSLMFGNFNKKIKDKKTDFDWLSVNEQNVTDYIADPLCGFGPRNNFCYGFIKGMISLYKKENLSKLDKNINIFIIGGENDPVTNYGKNSTLLVNMYHKYGVKNVTKKVYPGLRHEILNESNWEDIAKDIVNYYN